MITEINRVGGKILFKVTNTKGDVVAYRTFPEDGLGDATKGADFPSLKEALEEARKTLTVTKQVEQLNGCTIHKVSDGNGRVKGYMVDHNEHQCRTLKEARELAGGIKAGSPGELTKPKSSYAQNLPGYSASGAARVKKAS